MFFFLCLGLGLIQVWETNPACNILRHTPLTLRDYIPSSKLFIKCLACASTDAIRFILCLLPCLSPEHISGRLRVCHSQHLHHPLPSPGVLPLAGPVSMGTAYSQESVSQKEVQYDHFNRQTRGSQSSTTDQSLKIDQALETSSAVYSMFLT